MKVSQTINRMGNPPNHLCVLLIVVSLRFLPLLHAQPAVPSTTNSILQQELKQQQIKNTTQRVGDQLAAIISEFDRNAISGEDVKVLRAIRGVLGTLSEQDMKLVIEYLQKSRETNDPGASTRQATEAYARQKTIKVKLDALVAEYKRQTELYELSLRFKEFAKRQTAYMWQAVDLARRSENKPLTSLSESQQADLRLVQIDQEPIKDETLPYIGQLERITKENTDGPTAERPREALRRAKEGGLWSALDAANEELKVARLLSATGNQRRARDEFREIARLLILSQGEVESLRQALRELDQTIDQQKELMADTRKIEPKDTKIELRQAELGDNTDLIRRDVDSLAPLAAEELKNATFKMNEARQILNTERDARRQREKTPPKQAEALADMEQARRALEEQLAKAEELATTPENALAALRDLQEQVRELIKDEEKLKEETAAAEKKELASKAPRQGELKDTAQELQQKAAAQAPSAAQSIGEASSQMQKAQNSLASSQNNPAAQQAAIEALKKAEEQLAQDIAQLEEAQKELAALEDLLQKLIAIIEEQQNVQSSTSKEALKSEVPALTELSTKQEKLGDETGALQEEASKPVPKAATHLGSAKGHMGEAKSELDKPAPKVAQPRQGEALSDLYAAKKEIEGKIAELKNMLGMADDNAQALADAAAIIEQAQKDVDQALEQMQQTPSAMQEAGQSLENADNRIGPLTAGQLGPLPGAAQSALQSAQGSLSSGAAQASAGQCTPAQASAAAAAEALAQAQAALALAQAGLSAGQGQGQGQGQGRNPSLGQGQGQGPPGPQGTGRQGNWSGPGGADGPKRNTAGTGQFTGLPKRDRAAIQQSQSEKYPQEYGPLVEQYLKNLSDQSGEK